MVYLNYGPYLDPQIGPNWWEYFFEPILLGDYTETPVEVLDYAKSINWAWAVVRDSVDRQRDYDLIQRYIRIKPHIQAKINNFTKQNFENNFIIGVHYRGTDKFIAEAPFIPFAHMITAIQKAIDAITPTYGSNYKIFVATDEDCFLKYIQSIFSCPIIYTNCPRSKDGTSLHEGLHYCRNYQKGEDAVIDCLLLSKSNFLIRTSSNLSFISERFNISLLGFLIQQ